MGILFCFMCNHYTLFGIESKNVNLAVLVGDTLQVIIGANCGF